MDLKNSEELGTVQTCGVLWLPVGQKLGFDQMAADASPENYVWLFVCERDIQTFQKMASIR
jgi:hypothetical protein